MKENKVLLLAYTGLNFGDDMFIYTICKYFPEQQFYLQAPKNYNKTLNSLKNLTYFSRPRLLDKILYKINKDKYKEMSTKKYSAIVYVVGGLFDEDDIWKNMVKKYGLAKLKDMIWQNSFNNKVPFFLLGSNLTRIKTDTYIHQMEYLFEGLRDICFRDLYTYNHFKHLSNVRYAPDIVFNYKCNENQTKDDSVLISVWGPLTCTDKFPQWKWAEYLLDDYIDFLVNIINKFNSIGKKITLLALCENEGDLKACHLIRSRIDTYVDVVTYDGDLNAIIALFEKASFVVGTRFHSVIMALNAKCAFYPIVYESKTEQLLNDIGYTGKSSHIEKKDSYVVDDVINNYLSNKIVSIDKVKVAAAEQFNVLNKLLEG